MEWANRFQAIPLLAASRSCSIFPPARSGRLGRRLMCLHQLGSIVGPTLLASWSITLAVIRSVAVSRDAATVTTNG